MSYMSAHNIWQSTDETEAVHLSITDDDLKQSKIAAYNVGQTVAVPQSSKQKEVPYNPKKFPSKAVDIIFPKRELIVEVFFDPNTLSWDSDIRGCPQNAKLSPDEMGQFFTSSFYEKLLKKLSRYWPMTDDFYGSLYNGLLAKRMSVLGTSPDFPLSEEDTEDKNAPQYTASGRKIVSFSDDNVSSKSARFYCWPDIKKVYNWSTWKDWKKIKPLCRMRFKHGDRMYGLSLSTIGGDDQDYKNRGFRGYDLTPPPVQWLTKAENESVMKLSLVEKFLKYCIEKISKYIAEDPKDIYKKINNPDKITVEEIAKTRHCIRRTLNEIIKNHQIDAFRWS